MNHLVDLELIQKCIEHHILRQGFRLQPGIDYHLVMHAGGFSERWKWQREDVVYADEESPREEHGEVHVTVRFVGVDHQRRQLLFSWQDRLLIRVDEMEMRKKMDGAHHSDWYR